MKDEVKNILRLANLVRENVRSKQLFTLYNPILITLSGGQDSICSLLLLYLLQNQLELLGASADSSKEHALTRVLSEAEQTRVSGRKRLAEHEFYARTKPALAGEVSSSTTTLLEPVRLRVELTTLRSVARLLNKRPERCRHPTVSTADKRVACKSSICSKTYALLGCKPVCTAEHRLKENTSAGLAQPAADHRLVFGQASILLPILIPSLVEQAIDDVSPTNVGIANRPLRGKSAQKIFKLAVVSGFGPVQNRKFCTGPNQALFDFEKSAGLIRQFGLLWCNHFWQKESFHTMLHVAKINLCFSSTMCFYLPIESVLCEQNAREWRHKSIQRICTFFNYECCTQGHTKSDRVETILFNILRGTGIVGLQALQWKKSFYSFSCQKFYPCLSRSKLSWPQPTAPLLEFTQGLYKIGVFSKFCFIHVRTTSTFKLPTKCSYRVRGPLGLSAMSLRNRRFVNFDFAYQQPILPLHSLRAAPLRLQIYDLQASSPSSAPYLSEQKAITEGEALTPLSSAQNRHISSYRLKLCRTQTLLLRTLASLRSVRGPRVQIEELQAYVTDSWPLHSVTVHANRRVAYKTGGFVSRRRGLDYYWLLSALLSRLDR